MRVIQRFTGSRLNRATFTTACSTWILFAGLAGATGFDAPPGDEPRFDEGVLELLPGVDIGSVINRYGFTLRDSISSRNIHLVSFQPALTNDEFELLFLNDPEIDHSELNFDSGDAGPNSGSLFFNVAPAQFDIQPVWDTLGVDAAQTITTGAGVIVAIIDTGIDVSNPVFSNRIHPASINFRGDPANIQDIGNGVNDDGDMFIDEAVGHGTWIAGIIHRVAPDAMLMPIRALNDEGFTDSFTLAKAIYHAVENGADVINLSLGSLAEVRIVERAVDEAARLGVIPVAAAGNQGVGQPEFPAGNRKAIGVAAVELNGTLASFSNIGDGSGGNRLLLAAPGVDITGPIPNGFGEASGTSASVPLVAGTAALAKQLGIARRFSDFENLIKHTASDIQTQNPGVNPDAWGEGMLDIEAAANWSGPCYADLTDDGVLDLADLQQFLQSFVTGNEEADYLDPRGVWDLADLQFFVQEFVGGCP